MQNWLEAQVALRGFLPAEAQLGLSVRKVPFTLLGRQMAAEPGSQEQNKNKMQDGLAEEEFAQEEI